MYMYMYMPYIVIGTYIVAYSCIYIYIYNIMYIWGHGNM